MEFEKYMKELEEIVKKMEANDLSLEEMMALYKKGNTLKEKLTEILNDAKLKIEEYNE